VEVIFGIKELFVKTLFFLYKTYLFHKYCNCNCNNNKRVEVELVNVNMRVEVILLCNLKVKTVWVENVTIHEYKHDHGPALRNLQHTYIHPR